MGTRSFLFGGASGGGGGAGGGGGSVLNSALLANKRVPCSSSKPLDSFFISGSSPSFLGSRSMFSFEDGGNLNNGSGRPFFQSFDQEDIGDDDYDDYFRQPEKKRRLKADQVQFLEKSFETENKLEPERKIQLAKELGLQPRQIAIWFQNRRARWKTKQLEKDYDVLQENYNKLKANYENLLKEQEKLKSQVNDLSEKLLREKGTSDSSSSKSLSETLQQEQIADCAYEEDVSKVTNLAYVQEENVAAKGVVFDSESPRYTDGVHSSLLERGDSSYMFEHEQSDGSVDEEEDNNLLPSFGCIFPKTETTEYPGEPAVNSCYFGFPSDDQSFGFWAPYGM